MTISGFSLAAFNSGSRYLKIHKTIITTNLVL